MTSDICLDAIMPDNERILNVFSNKECIEDKDSEQQQNQTGTTANLPLIDIFLNPEKNANKENLEAFFKNLSLSTFPTRQLSTIYPNLFRIMWYSGLPCFHQPDVTPGFLLKNCSWAGQDVDCRKIFETVPTDSGMCCAFNLKSDLKPSNYSTFVKTMQNEDKGNSGESIPTKPQVGINKGLRLVVDRHSNMVSSGSVFNDHEAGDIMQI